jgi:hypothetical protein
VRKCAQNKGKSAFFESQKFEISLARRFLLTILWICCLNFVAIPKALTNESTWKKTVERLACLSDKNSSRELKLIFLNLVIKLSTVASETKQHGQSTYLTPICTTWELGAC